MSTLSNTIDEIKQQKIKEAIKKEVTNIKPVTICGWCGAIETYLSNGRTECPNCDEYLH